MERGYRVLGLRLNEKDGDGGQRIREIRNNLWLIFSCGLF